MKEREIHLCFVRRCACGIENLIVLKMIGRSDIPTETEALEALKRSVTRWVETTTAGSEMWTNSGKDLNIGDLCGWVTPYIEDDNLRGILEDEGLTDVQLVYELIDQEEIPFDTILASPK